MADCTEAWPAVTGMPDDALAEACDPRMGPAPGAALAALAVPALRRAPAATLAAC
jgi:hypothetical protein